MVAATGVTDVAPAASALPPPGGALTVEYVLGAHLIIVKIINTRFSNNMYFDVVARNRSKGAGLYHVAKAVAIKNGIRTPGPPV